MAVSSNKFSDTHIGLKSGNTALDNYMVVSLPVVASLGAGVANTTKQLFVTLPIDAQIVGVQAMDDSNTGNVTVDIWNEAGTPATILSAPVTIATALTSYAGTVASATTAYAQGAIFSLRCTTVASTGAATNVRVFLALKNAKAHVVSA